VVQIPPGDIDLRWRGDNKEIEKDMLALPEFLFSYLVNSEAQASEWFNMVVDVS
jgi:hypothetical protein